MPDPANIYERLNLETHLKEVMGNIIKFNLKDAAGDLL